MRALRLRSALVLWATLGLACGPGPRDNGPNCTSICTSFGFQQCHEDGTFDPPEVCGPDEVCDPAHGCVVCVPDDLYCAGPTANDVYRCNKDGTGGTQVESCPADNVCSGGQCKTPCDAAEDHPSNVGCDFWAADLDNESSTTFGISNDAAAQQFAVVAANNNDYPIMVTVTKNAANVGQPINEQAILQVTVPPRAAQRMDLPQREVDGSMAQNGTYAKNSGSGTFVSPHAYHVKSTGPMVLYQFNPIIQQYSNDASTLIPRQALGMDYIVVGFETANPCAITGLPLPDNSIPDHGAVTIIPIEDDTHVTVTTSHGIKASGGPSGLPIALTPKGGTLNLTLSRYMVANLESEMTTGSIGECTTAVNAGADGDFTGTYIKSDKPVVVFTSNERGIGFGGADVVYPPGWDTSQGGDDICCTDHLEEQLFPVTALGREFAVARSPIRSTHATWKEPDIIRVVGTTDGTTITTNLPAPWNSFTLNARQDKTFAATTGFTLSASAAVQVSSYLVPQHFVKYGFTGDPSQIMIPAAEQHRKDYVFLVPATFQSNYGVFAKPVDAHLMVDGVALDGVEFSSCVKAPIGTVMGVDFEQVTCLLADGKHQVTGDKPFGLSVYGYYNVGSYAFVGGSDVKIINPIL
ncbi:MAG: IgGFc-binding protein [Myxococcales bacterium]|nr:IgGFc-binding protein [Myxococcales bacterium]